MKKSLKTIALLLISMPLFSQIRPLTDTIFYTIVDSFVAIRTKQTLLVNNTADIAKFKFKINRINVPDDVYITFFDERSHYFENISSCNLTNSTITLQPGSCTTIGMYDLFFEEIKDTPWEFSYDVYRAPNCDSLLARLFFKITSGKTPPSGIPPASVWTYRPYSLTFENKKWQVYPVRDTIINAQAYAILAIDRGNGPVKESEIPVAIINKKMYFVEDNIQKLMYNFSIDQKIGDTLSYYVPQVAPLYDITSHGGSTQPSKNIYQLLLKGKGFQFSGGNSIDYFDYEPVPNNLQEHSVFRVFEHTGSEFGLFGAFRPRFTAGLEGELLTYKSDFYNFDNNEMLECKITSTQNVVDQVDINIFPNPTYDKITATTDERIEEISLFDMNGNLIQAVFDTNEMALDNIKGGLYVIKLNVKNRKSVFRKLTVIK